MASGDEVALISAVVALTLLLVLIVGIFVVISSLDDSPAVGAGGAGGTAAGATAAGPAGGLAGAWTAKKRVYTSGVRLEELFRWTSLEASEALAAYASQMEGDEREAFYARLPQITNLVLGLDHSGPDKPVGWLNEQYKLLVEPNKDARAAAQLQSRLQDVLEAPPPSSASSPLRHHKRPSSSSSSSVFGIGGRPAERQRYGIVFEELVADAGRAPEAGMDYKYTFFCKYLPVPAQKALAEGQQQLVPQLFLQCLAQGMAGGAVAARPPRGGTEEPQGLVLSAWVYFLFCFCLWPASDHGQNALDGSVTPASSGLPGMLGGRSQSEPLYVVLLNSYLKYFIHLEKPCWPESGGSLLLQAIAQFWLCQNAAPSVAEKLSPQPFQDTKASILLCLEHVVRHVNAHVAEHLAQYEPHYAGGLSAHGALQPAMYHYFEKQVGERGAQPACSACMPSLAPSATLSLPSALVPRPTPHAPRPSSLVSRSSRRFPTYPHASSYSCASRCSTYTRGGPPPTSPQTAPRAPPPPPPPPPWQMAPRAASRRESSPTARQRGRGRPSCGTTTCSMPGYSRRSRERCGPAGSASTSGRRSATCR